MARQVHGVGKTYMKVMCQPNRDRKLEETGLIKLLKGLPMAANFERLFRDYVRTHRVKEQALANGLAIKKQQTIVATYPLRVTDNSKREFDWSCAAVLMGGERYL
jgi:hypothetical protein